jgi:hypothetical protein
MEYSFYVRTTFHHFNVLSINVLRTVYNANPGVYCTCDLQRTYNAVKHSLVHSVQQKSRGRNILSPKPEVTVNFLKLGIY